MGRKSNSETQLGEMNMLILGILHDIEWQTEVFKLANSDNPEDDAFKFICKFKTLYYVAKEAGYLASDKELDKAIAFNIETYEQMKKDGEVDYAIYPHFYGRVCYDGRVRLGEDRIDISQYVNNYTL